MSADLLGRMASAWGSARLDEGQLTVRTPIHLVKGEGVADERPAGGVLPYCSNYCVLIAHGQGVIRWPVSRSSPLPSCIGCQGSPAAYFIDTLITEKMAFQLIEVHRGEPAGEQALEVTAGRGSMDACFNSLVHAGGDRLKAGDDG
jgi:hypothetical protein